MPASIIDEVGRKVTTYLEDLNHYKLDPIWHSTPKEPNIYAEYSEYSIVSGIDQTWGSICKQLKTYKFCPLTLVVAKLNKRKNICESSKIFRS